MLTRWARALIIAFGWSWAAAVAVGCHQSPYDLARSDDEALRSRADTLLLLLSVAEPVSPKHDATEAEPSEVSRERVWIDAKRIVDVTLEIDGTPLGKFKAVHIRAVPTAGAGVVTAERDSALIRADFSDLYDATTLKTVGDWVKALSKTVGTGTHVLTVVGLTLSTDSGTRVAYEARAFLPFSVDEGATTAFAGHAELVLPGEHQ